MEILANENTIQSFEFNGFVLRGKLVNTEPVFIGADACAALEIRNSRDALSRIDLDDVGITDVIDSLGRTQQMKTVNESGLYQLIFQSRTNGAKAFKKWVTSEVLPQIRKTGSYEKPKTLEERSLEILGELSARVEQQQRELETARPKAQAYDEFLGATGLISMKRASDLLTEAGVPIGRNSLFKELERLGWIYRESGAWVPMESKKRQGLITAKAQTRPDYASIIPGVRKLADPKIHLTPKGLHRLRELLLPPIQIEQVA